VACPRAAPRRPGKAQARHRPPADRERAKSDTELVEE
jgi:hypothetical protein